MRYIATYDIMETMRNTNQWLGATASALGSYPAVGLFPSPVFKMLAAWGDVTERSFARMVAKPDWGIDSITSLDGRDMVVSASPEFRLPFGDLVRFDVSGRPPRTRRILLVAPMSGHYSTLLRSTVTSLLPDADVWITDWHNARDIPVSVGKFDIEDYTRYLVEFMRQMGPDTHVIAICQPAPLALAATAMLAEDDPEAQPRTLTLIGGPIDPDAADTGVTDFGRRVTMGQLEEFVIQRVGFNHAGAGRMVYPGLSQLSSFVSMNLETHVRAFTDQIMNVSQGTAGDYDKHNRFYDEYLAVMDMTAEFYLSTVERLFKGREIALNAFTVDGKKVDIGKITRVAVKTVEGEEDDISAPGQCIAALDLLTGLPDSKKLSHVEPGAGHYGIFAGRKWRNNIRPLVLNFIDANSPPAATPRTAADLRAAALAAPEPDKVEAAPPRDATPAENHRIAPAEDVQPEAGAAPKAEAQPEPAPKPEAAPKVDTAPKGEAITPKAGIAAKTDAAAQAEPAKTDDTASKTEAAAKETEQRSKGKGKGKGSARRSTAAE